MDQTSRIHLPRALLFDMDGTLTQPFLDFPAIKREMGIPLDEAILEAMSKMSPEQFSVAEEILHRREEEAAMNSVLNPGCEELLRWVHTKGMEIALVTRNSRKSVETVFGRHGLKIDVTITREDEVCKPAPDPLLLACRRLGTTIEQSWMIGDGHHDIEAAVAAKMTSIWISHDRDRTFIAIPTYICRDLLELHKFLQSCDNDPH
jgi:HAD superfamily hydrolase (TIGR01509 family)